MTLLLRSNVRKLCSSLYGNHAEPGRKRIHGKDEVCQKCVRVWQLQCNKCANSKQFIRAYWVIRTYMKGAVSNRMMFGNTSALCSVSRAFLSLVSGDEDK